MPPRSKSRLPSEYYRYWPKNRLPALPTIATEENECVVRQFTSGNDYQHLAKAEMGTDHLYIYGDGTWLIYGLYHEPDWVRVEVKGIQK